MNSSAQYIILPGKVTSPDTPSEATQLLDRAYYLWKTIWDQTFTSNGVDKKVSPDDFFRQTFIPIIKNDTDIIAVHLYSIYNLSSEVMKEHSYLKNNFNDQFWSIMKKENIRFVMSMESLAINPLYRKSISSTSYAFILINLGVNLFLNYTECDGIIAPARTDVGVANHGYEMGFSAAIKDVMLYNTPVDYVFLRRTDKINPSKNDILNIHVNNLWKNRTSYLKNLRTTHFKKVA